MVRQYSVKDQKYESRLIGNRIFFAGVCILLLTLMLIGRMFYLQIIQHDHFTTLSRDNQVQIRPLPPIRGLIFSSDNVLLADNRPSFSLEIIPENISGNLEQVITRLQEYIRIEEQDIRRYKELAKKKRRFERTPIRLNLTDEEVASFSVNRHLFNGVDVVAGLSRYYPIGPNLAHVVGYVGRIDKDELAILDTSDYSGTTYIGKIGAEKAFEEVLHGKVGYEQVEVNAQGRVIRQLDTTPPESGENVYLTLNVSLQNLAAVELAGKRGAIVAIDPRNGSVLALVSSPGYDPNIFINGIDPTAYKQLVTSKDKPLLNRALQGAYPPGSTIKPFMGFAAINSNVRQPQDNIWCPGWFRIAGGQRQYRDSKKGGHGHMNLTSAIASSCDVYFYSLALEMGINRLYTAMQEFGFGSVTGIDISGEATGLMPSPEWKKKTRNQAWYPGETVNVGVGQGYLLVTPIQLAAATAALVNRGVRIKPRLLAEVRDPVVGELTQLPDTGNKVTIMAKDPAFWDIVINAMVEVVHGANGTARAIGNGAKYKLAGKTGTAQVFSMPQDKYIKSKDMPEELRDHALFIAFAPAEQPTIVISIIVENGGFGSAAAAPIARRLFDHWINEAEKGSL
ncbi:MAG: penicillin-binding protein 2 [Gammaproteobacteria bacterium RIFCSPLOWO2_02_FULL_52_10]|nr:MAG: penicillin-binding protein 2 [Gammaproteobacteria bacterium RIFCSPLOWO2_02_FULL_52_10]OGT82279.1 MAG: penicillin-binding protein 2 [Gammaproteobacteria bacterium RIFCSPLOWO2_12_FULL_52_10]